MENHAPPAGRGLPRDPAKERSWRELLKQFATSGQSAREFCAERQLRETALYFWRREIQRRDAQSPARQRSTPFHAGRPVAFAQVLVRSPELPEMHEGPRLVLGSGRQLLLPASMTMEHVAQLLRAIERPA